VAKTLEENEDDLLLDGNCPFPALKLGNSESVKLEDKIYITGYPGSIAGKTLQKSFYITSVTDKITGKEGGYAIDYKADTVGGMSGSPVFNQFGEVIAVHGRSYPVNPDPNSRAFFDLGIPINVFKLDGVVKASQPVSSRGNDNSVPWISIFTIVIVIGGILSLIIYFLNAEIFSPLIGIGVIIILPLLLIALLNPYSYLFIGEIKYNLGQKEAAILDFNTAIAFYPNFAIAYYNRGNAKSALGDKNGAKKD
jgi:tetratricopeptide (TPR) repeat protein